MRIPNGSMTDPDLRPCDARNRPPRRWRLDGLLVAAAAAWTIALASCSTINESNITVFGDASLLGAQVLVDGAPAGVLAERRNEQVWIAFEPRANSGWPGQSRGDTVFAAGEMGACWSGTVSGPRHTLVCRDSLGRTLEIETTSVVSQLGVLASFRRNSIHSWVVDY